MTANNRTETVGDLSAIFRRSPINLLPPVCSLQTGTILNQKHSESIHAQTNLRRKKLCRMEVNQINDMDSLTAEAKWFSAAPMKHVKRSGSDDMSLVRRKFTMPILSGSTDGRRGAVVMMNEIDADHFRFQCKARVVSQ